MELNKIIRGNCLTGLKTLPDACIDCVVTSPPYWSLRDYGVDGQLGLEPTFQEYINKLCDIFNEVKRVLKPSGTCWVNLGDSYASSGGAQVTQTAQKNSGFEWTDSKVQQDRKNINYGVKNKCLCQIPSRFAIEMTNRGWILRNEIIWYKRNCMPASVTDRFTVDFEKIFFFTKSKKYFFDQQFEDSLSPIKKPKTNPYSQLMQTGGKETQKLGTGNIEGRNKRCVWDITTKGEPSAHFAVYPQELIETPIRAGCPENGIVLDPFFGSGTTGIVAKKLGRNYIGIEINPEYIKIAEKRLYKELGMYL